MSKIYLSGPVSGTNDARERFHMAENRLKRRGHKNIINPVEFCSSLPKDTKYEDYLLIGMALMHQCDTVYMMLGWKDSPGANAERKEAIENGKNIIYEENECKAY